LPIRLLAIILVVPLRQLTAVTMVLLGAYTNG
jgi:hypothetical protein